MEQSYSGPERRRFKRVKVNFTLIYRAGVPLSTRIAIDDNNSFDALMLDLSQEGMAFLTNSNILIETQVMLRFTLINLSADNDARVNNMDMTAEVVSNAEVSAGEYRLGIEFTQISNEDKNVIAEFVKNREPLV